MHTTTIETNELILVRLLQQKSTHALTALYRLYAKALYLCICRIVEDEHLAEDILQESFVKIWNNAKFYDAEKGRLYTWMHNICHNTAIDKMRSKSFKNRARTSGDNAIDHRAGKHLFDHIKPEILGVKEMVDKLKPEWKTIVQYVYFNGYTHQETARELNLPLGTVKTRLRRAIISMRQLF